MANTIIGKVIAISDQQTIQSKDASKQPTVKRQLYLDCTRYDPYTGEKGYPNTPLLEFSRRGLEKLEALMDNGLNKGDVVTVTFDVQGVQYEDKDGKKKVFTSIRPYDIEFTKKVEEKQSAPAPAPAPMPENDDALPF